MTIHSFSSMSLSELSSLDNLSEDHFALSGFFGNWSEGSLPLLSLNLTKDVTLDKAKSVFFNKILASDLPWKCTDWKLLINFGLSVY
jgi:hypothetical protein